MASRSTRGGEEAETAQTRSVCVPPSRPRPHPPWPSLAPAPHTSCDDHAGLNSPARYGAPTRGGEERRRVVSGLRRLRLLSTSSPISYSPPHSSPAPLTSSDSAILCESDAARARKEGASVRVAAIARPVTHLEARSFELELDPSGVLHSSGLLVSARTGLNTDAAHA